MSIKAISMNRSEQCLVEMVKKRLQVTVREDIVNWIDRQVEKLRFASRSHAIEYALLQLMEQEKNE
jgi:Arc/MetJ-type ribon-helix-helix transcriptional regulator